jgi:two-component system, OmpR family, sensor kinase
MGLARDHVAECGLERDRHRRARCRRHRRLQVRDDGPGIPPGVRPHVFERFVRANQARSHTSGNARIGLSIVAAIVHAGHVEVASEPGCTEFTVSLRTDPHERRIHDITG